MTPSSHFNTCHGRTLLEICVTLALFALTGAVSAPRLSALSQQLKVRQLTETIEESIRYLPTISRQHHETILIKTDFEKLALTIRSNPERKLRIIPIPPALSIHINTSGQRIYAYPGGSVSPARIIINGPALRCTLTLSLWGRIRRSCVTR